MATSIKLCVVLVTLAGLSVTTLGDDSLAKGAAANHRTAAEKLMAAGKYTNAIEELDKAVSADPKHYLSYYKRGIAQKILGKTHKALDDLSKAIDLNTDPFSTGYATRASTYLSLGMCDSAEGDYKKAASIDASSAEAQGGLRKAAQCKSYHQQADEALEAADWGRLRQLITPAIQLSPDSSSLLLKRADLNYNDRHFNMVLLDTGRVIKLHHDNVHALRVRAQAYFQIGDTDVALRHIREALRMDPDNRVCMKLFKKLKKFNKAMTTGDKKLSQNAALRAIEHYKEAMSLAEDNAFFAPRILLKRCEAEVKIGRGQAAVETCTNSINLDASNIDAYLTRGDAYLIEENFQEAQKDFQKAQEMDQNNRRAHEGMQRCKKLEKMASRKDYYKILGVAKDATTRQIKKAYKKMAMLHHPDKNPDDKEAAQERFRDIAEAHEVLADDELRQRYDNGDDLQATPQNDPFGHGGGFGGFGGGGGGYSFNFKFG